MATPEASGPDPADSTPDLADVPPETLVQVGFVFRPHGIDGELKIDPSHTDDPARFETLPFVYLGPHSRRVTKHAIESVRYQQTKRGVTVILGVEGVEDRDDAEVVAKQKVFASEEALELEEGTFLVQDIIGMEVVTEDEAVLGTIANYMEMPAQDMLVVRKPDGGEAMIPAVEDFLIDIDEDTERITVRPIDGLME